MTIIGPAAASSPPMTIMMPCVVPDKLANDAASPVTISINPAIAGASALPIASCAPSIADCIFFMLPTVVSSMVSAMRCAAPSD